MNRLERNPVEQKDRKPSSWGLGLTLSFLTLITAGEVLVEIPKEFLVSKVEFVGSRLKRKKEVKDEIDKDGEKFIVPGGATIRFQIGSASYLVFDYLTKIDPRTKRAKSPYAFLSIETDQGNDGRFRITKIAKTPIGENESLRLSNGFTFTHFTLKPNK